MDLTDFGGDDGAAFAGTEGDYAVDDGVHDGVDLPVVDDCGEACMFYTTGLPDNAVEGEARGVTADFAADLDTFDSAADYLDTGPDDALAAEPRSPHTALLVPAAPVTAPTLIRGGKLNP